MMLTCSNFAVGTKTMDRKLIAIVILLVALVLSTILLIDNTFFNERIKNFVGDEAFKAVLQFSFVTMLGGALFVYLNIVKDEEVNRELRNKDEEVSRELRNSDKGDLAKEIDKLYRSTKHIKRTLRSRSVKDGNVMYISEEFFEKNLDELDKIQIAIEQNREIIKVRIDLFDDAKRKRLVSALNYAARYLHDVFQDFEKNRVSFNDGRYIISDQSRNIQDFLSSKPLPNELPNDREIPKEISYYLTFMKNDDISNVEKWAAFDEILRIRKSSNDGKRYKAVAEECFSLAATELKSS
jgi:hypothetical protein